MWSDFNAANRSAMMKSELFSWPVTLAILAARVRLARRRQPAADADDRRPDRLGRRALPRHAVRRHLDLVDELRAHVRARARHRLRPLHRRALPRRALRQRPVTGRRRRRRDGHRRQGRALQRHHRPDLALGGDARAESGVPLDGARDHGRRRASSSPRRSRCCRPCSARSDRRSTTSRCSGCTPASTARRSSPAGPSASGPSPLLYGIPALLVLLALAAPVLGLKTGMPSIKVVPAGDSSRIGYTQVQAAFGAGAPGRAAARRPRPRRRRARRDRQGRPRHRQRHADADLERRPLRAGAGDPAPEPLRPRRRPHHRPPALRAAGRRARRRRRRREPRPRDVRSRTPRRS